MAEIVWFPPVRKELQLEVSLLDVMECFVRWNQLEKPLFDRLNRTTEVPYSWFLETMSKWRMIHQFPKKKRETALQQQRISRLLTDFKHHKDSIDYVTVLAHSLSKYTSKAKEEDTKIPLAAASVILWYINRDDVVIYNRTSQKSISYLLEQADIPPPHLPIAKQTADYEAEFEFEIELDEEDAGIGLDLEIEFPVNLQSYFDFHQCWIEMYLEHVATIHMLCDNLYELCEFQGVPESVDIDCLSEEWFHRRVFSTWLNNLATAINGNGKK